MENIVLKVPDMSCGHCVEKIQSAVQSIEGVSGIWADTESRSVEIEFTPPASQAQLKEVLAEINYPVED